MKKGSTSSTSKTPLPILSRASFRGLGACIAPFENSVPKTPGDNLYTLTRSALRAFVFDRCLFCKRKGLDSLIRLADGASLSCVVVLVEAYSSRRSTFSDIHHPFVLFPEDVNFGDSGFTR